MISESGANLWTASTTTKPLADPSFAAGLRFMHEVTLPAIQSTPSFLAAHSWTAPLSPTACPFQAAHSTPLSAFPWLTTHAPALAADFQRFMAATHAHHGSLFRALPRGLLEGVRAEDPLLVDVGGGRGASCVALRRDVPGLRGWVECQDTEGVVGAVEKEEAEEREKGERKEGEEGEKDWHMRAHDFFTPQPVRGARAYLLRRVLHDWGDGECVSILGHIAAAMTPAAGNAGDGERDGERDGEGKGEADDAGQNPSLLLIDEVVLPNAGAHWVACEADLLMMASLGAQERTRGQWEALLRRAGLVVRECYGYVRETGESVLVAVREG